MVNFSGVLRKISGSMKAFQWKRNEKIATVVIAGRQRGTRISQRTRIELAPSILAASSKSRGIVRKNWRSRKRKTGPPPNQGGTISGARVSSQPSHLNSRKLGTIVTSQGTISVERTSMKKKLLKGKRKRAKP